LALPVGALVPSLLPTTY